MTLTPVQVSTGFNKMLGITLLEWGPEGMMGQLRMTPDMLNSSGIAHGGIYCTLLDFGCGVAGCYAPEGAPPKFCVTLSLTTNFLASAAGGVLTVRARRSGGGRKVFFAEAEIRDETGALMATATGTFRYISPRNGALTTQPPADRARPEE